MATKELVPDMILFNNSVNLENGKQHLNPINRKMLKMRKLPITLGEENNSNSTKLHPQSSKISSKVSHPIGQGHVPEFASG